MGRSVSTRVFVISYNKTLPSCNPHKISLSDPVFLTWCLVRWFGDPSQRPLSLSFLSPSGSLATALTFHSNFSFSAVGEIVRSYQFRQSLKLKTSLKMSASESTNLERFGVNLNLSKSMFPLSSCIQHNPHIKASYGTVPPYRRGGWGQMGKNWIKGNVTQTLSMTWLYVHTFGEDFKTTI